MSTSEWIKIKAIICGSFEPFSGFFSLLPRLWVKEKNRGRESHTHIRITDSSIFYKIGLINSISFRFKSAHSPLFFSRLSLPLPTERSNIFPIFPSFELSLVSLAVLSGSLDLNSLFFLSKNRETHFPCLCSSLSFSHSHSSLCWPMDGGGAYNPRTVEEVFRDFKGRRAGMIKALTTDVEEFFQQCDPEKENLCLYGFPSEQWEVNLPAEEVPPELPEPALGINFARDGMQEKDWLSLVAVHSDAWLLAVAFYFGARFGFDKADRKRLFNMINELPTIFEVVTGGMTKKQSKEKSSVSNHSSNKSKSNPKRGSESQGKYMKAMQSKDEEDEGLEEEEYDEHGDTLCGACGENYAADEFWICCDICEKWFHGKCVKITPARAEHIKQYKCPSCSNKRARP